MACPKDIFSKLGTGLEILPSRIADSKSGLTIGDNNSYLVFRLSKISVKLGLVLISLFNILDNSIIASDYLSKLNLTASRYPSNFLGSLTTSLDGSITYIYLRVSIGK